MSSACTGSSSSIEHLTHDVQALYKQLADNVDPKQEYIPRNILGTGFYTTLAERLPPVYRSLSRADWLFEVQKRASPFHGGEAAQKEYLFALRSRLFTAAAYCRQISAVHIVPAEDEQSTDASIKLVRLKHDELFEQLRVRGLHQQAAKLKERLRAVEDAIAAYHEDARQAGETLETLTNCLR